MKGKKFTHEGIILAMPRLAYHPCPQNPNAGTLVESTTKVRKCDLSIKSTQINLQWGYVHRLRVDGHLLVKIITSEERMHHF